MHKTLLLSFRSFRRGESGQAFLEFTFIALMMIIMLFGLIDFGRFVYQWEIMVNLSREGSNLASRGNTLSEAVAAVTNSASPLNLLVNGAGVIATSVTNYGSGFDITGQFKAGGVTTSASKVGSGVGTKVGRGTISASLPPVNQTLYITEVFCHYTPTTPIGKLLQITLPTTNYDAAYFVGL